MVTMSQKEFQRVKVIENAAGGRLSVREASRLLQLSERQVQRLKRRYRPDSVAWVQHGNRGRSMPWAFPLPQKRLILSLARGKYQGFNDSHLCEKLNCDEDLSVSRETVRRLLRAAKLASPQKRRPRQYRSRRPPRPRFGMMALTDASRHDWLQGRGPELTLIGFQDDATGPDPGRSLPTQSRKYPRLSPRSPLHDRHSRHPAQPLSRPPQHLPAQRCPLDPGRTTRWKTNPHPTRTGSRPTRYPADSGLLAPGQRPHRTRLAHLPGPSGQRTSPRPRHHLAASQRCARSLLRRLQPALCPARGRRHARLSLPAPPLRSGPLPQLALPARRRRRPHRQLRRPRHRPAALARPSRLRRRNRRTLAPARWYAARLSRRRSAVGPAAAAARIFGPPPGSTHHGAETKTHDAPHLQPRRPPRFSGRYLNDKGVTESRCS